MKIKWCCKCCGLAGELDGPITGIKAIASIKSAHADSGTPHYRCDAIAIIVPYERLLLTLEINANDVLGANGLLARVDRREITLYLLAVQ